MAALSVELVRGVLSLRDTRLTPSDRFVLLDYAEHANGDTRRSWPSTATVSDETGLGQSTVERAMTKLRGFGYLVKVARQRVGEHAWVWVYEVDLAAEDPSLRGDVSEGSLGNAVEDPSERGTNRKEEPEEETLLEVVNLQQRRRATDPLFDAIIAVCEIDLKTSTASGKAAVGKVRRELAAVGATAEDVKTRAELYHRRWRGASLTPQALAKHWASLTPPPAPTRDSWLEGYR